jgi:hypothetical protein
MGTQAARDKARTGSYFPDDDEQDTAVAQDNGKLPAGADPKVYTLQKQLIAKGAKIPLDGKMGPLTQAAQKQFGGETVAESIASLRDRLAMIENESQTDEGFGDLFKGAANLGKGIKAGLSGGAAASEIAAKGGAAANKGLQFGKKFAGAGQAVKGAVTGNTAKNIAKVGGGAALGAAGVAALGGGTSTVAKNKTTTGTVSQNAQVDPNSDKAALIKQIQDEMAWLSDIEQPDVQKALANAQQQLDVATKASAAQLAQDTKTNAATPAAPGGVQQNAQVDPHAADMANAAGYNGPDGVSAGS